MKKILLFLPLLISLGTQANEPTWTFVNTEGSFDARHECGFVACNGKFYLLGGRGIKPTNCYDPQTNTLTAKAKPPIEMHHFQAVSFENEIYILGAQTGGYPLEPALPYVLIYNPETDSWRKGDIIPEKFRRGAAGCVVYHDKFYLVGGIRNGHFDGNSNQFTEYDPANNTWKALPNAPEERDHFHAVVLGNSLYAIGGRTTHLSSKHVFDLTVGTISVYNFETGSWSTPELSLPSPRAGCTAVAHQHKIYIMGGESGLQPTAHKEVNILNTRTMQWEAPAQLQTGRHGTQAVLDKNTMYIASGCGNRGGKPELNSMEAFSIPE